MAYSINKRDTFSHSGLIEGLQLYMRAKWSVRIGVTESYGGLYYMSVEEILSTCEAAISAVCEQKEAHR